MRRKSSSGLDVEREDEKQLLRVSFIGRKKRKIVISAQFYSSRLQQLMVLVGHSAQHERRLPREQEFSLELNKNRLGNSTRPGTAPIKQIRYK